MASRYTSSQRIEDSGNEDAWEKDVLDGDDDRGMVIDNAEDGQDWDIPGQGSFSDNGVSAYSMVIYVSDACLTTSLLFAMTRSL